MKWLKVALIVLGSVLLLAVAAMALVALWFRAEFPDHRGCRPDGPAAKYARSLPQKRLARLYRDMRVDYHKGRDSSISYEELPQYADLEVRVVRPWGEHITVEGCFDNYMYMRFHGFDDGQEPSITLTCGEFEEECKNEKLWPE